MRSSGADQRQDNIDDTARLPVLPSSLFPASPADDCSAVPEDREPAAADGKTAVLGPTLCFKGDLSAEEDFILQGRVEGSIHHAQRIFIGTGGVVVGNIHARVVVVDGNVEGDLHGAESVTVHKTGRVVGKIFAPRVALVEGAVFNGRIDMNGASAVDQDANQGAGNPPARKRVESSMMSPGLRLSAEQTDKGLTPKVALVPPPPLRERAG